MSYLLWLYFSVVLIFTDGATIDMTREGPRPISAPRLAFTRANADNVQLPRYRGRKVTGAYVWRNDR